MRIDQGTVPAPALASVPSTDPAAPGRRPAALTAGRGGDEYLQQQREAAATAALVSLDGELVPALRDAVEGRQFAAARQRAGEVRRALAMIAREGGDAGDVEQAAARWLALAPPPLAAPAEPILCAHPSAEELARGAASDRQDEAGWLAQLDVAAAQGASNVIPFPHRDALRAALGHDPGTAVVDASACAAAGVPAFTRAGTSYFADAAPDLLIAAHEAAHHLQHTGGSRDLGLGAEGHASAVADAVTRGADATVLLGERGDRVDAGMHGFTVDMPDVEAIEEAAVAGRREREYRPVGMLAVRVDENHHRFWSFDVDDALPRVEFLEPLTAIAQLLRDEPDSRVDLHGHTSASGPERRNEGLGLRRAQAIHHQLQAMGARNLVTVFTHGERAPLADERKGAAAMARNRRVEMHLHRQPKPPPLPAPPPAPADDPSLPFCGDLSEEIKFLEFERAVWTSWMRNGMRASADGSLMPDLRDDLMVCNGARYSLAELEVLQRRMSLPGIAAFQGHLMKIEQDILRAKDRISQDRCEDGSSGAWRILKPNEVIGPDGQVIELDGDFSPRDPMAGDTSPTGRKY